MSEIRYDVRRALSLGFILTIIIAALVLIFDNESSPLFLKFRLGTNTHPYPPLLAVGAAFLLGMGLGSQLTLCYSNRERLGEVFRPNLGRIICALFLALLAPMSNLWMIPISPIWAVPEVIGELLRGSLPRGNTARAFLYFLVVASPVAYSFSSLIISGVQSRIVRVALFGQVWLAVYGTVLIVFGRYSGPL